MNPYQPPIHEPRDIEGELREWLEWYKKYPVLATLLYLTCILVGAGAGWGYYLLTEWLGEKMFPFLHPLFKVIVRAVF